MLAAHDRGREELSQAPNHRGHPISVVNPLLKEQYDLSPSTLGLVSAAAIVGAIFGAGLLGPLADKIGRRCDRPRLPDRRLLPGRDLPKKARGRWLVGAFSLQAVGILRPQSSA